jgi:hypothetical protein
MESLLDSAYQTGNSIDLSLVGGSGTSKITSSTYEQYMNVLLKDPSTTESDKQRLQNKIFSVGYNKTAEDMVNGFNEKKYTAQNLVDFYDKELAAAKANGLTEESKTYRDILASRASAVARAKSDGLQARQDFADKRANAKGDELARDMQTLLKSTLPAFIMDKNTLRLLTGKIGANGGYTWMAGLTNYLNANNVSMTDIMSQAASSLGWNDATLNEAIGALGDAVDEITSLNSQGYSKELGGWTNFITGFSTAVTQGAFAASNKQAVLDFNTAYGKAGGSVTMNGAAEPSKGAAAINKLIAAVSGQDINYNPSDMQTQEIIKGIGTGNIGALTGGTPGTDTIDGLLDAIVASTGGERVDAAYSLSQYLDGIARYPDRKQAGAVADYLNSIGMNSAALLAQVGPRGTGMSVAQILAIKISTETLPREAEKSKTKSMAYVWTPTGNGTGEGAFTFQVKPDAEIRSAKYSLGFNADGSSYYVQTINSSAGGGNAVQFVAVPGGGGQEVGQGYMDSNDLVVMTVNGKKYKFTADDIQSLNDYASKYGTSFDETGIASPIPGEYSLPRVTTVNGIDFVLSSGTINAITMSAGGAFNSWISYRSTPGSDSYDPTFSKRTYAQPNVPVVVGVDKIEDYAKDVRATIYGAKSVNDAVSQYMKSHNIIDPKGTIAQQLYSRLQPSWDNGNWKIDGQTYTGQEEKLGPPIPTTPPEGRGPGNTFGSTDPSFGIKTTPPPSFQSGNRDLGRTQVPPTAPVPTAQGAADYIGYTLRRLGPEGGNPEGARPVIQKSNLPPPMPSVPLTSGGISPSAPGAPKPSMSMRPPMGGAGSDRNRIRSL